MENKALEQKQDGQTKEQRKAANKKLIIKIVLITGIVLAVLALMLLPYAITRNDGFPKLLAQVPMFLSMILCFIIGFATIANAGLQILQFVFNSSLFDDWRVIAIHILITIVGAAICLGLAMMLISLGYVNPFTGDFFKLPFVDI